MRKSATVCCNMLDALLSHGKPTAGVVKVLWDMARKTF